jgi:hypothetical protein
LGATRKYGTLAVCIREVQKTDAMAIWIAQFLGREIRMLDYIEGVGQPLAYYANELRRRGWKDAVIHLPHDGMAKGKKLAGGSPASTVRRRSRTPALARR